jgi:hypothetical protein
MSKAKVCSSGVGISFPRSFLTMQSKFGNFIYLTIANHKDCHFEFLDSKSVKIVWKTMWGFQTFEVIEHVIPIASIVGLILIDIFCAAHGPISPNTHVLLVSILDYKPCHAYRSCLNFQLRRVTPKYAHILYASVNHSNTHDMTHYHHMRLE